MKKLNITKVIDQYGWSYDFIGKEQQRYTTHNLVINKYDNINLEGLDIIYIHSPNIHTSLTNLPIIAHQKGIKVIGAYGGDPNYWNKNIDPKYTYVDLVVTISPETYKFAKKLYPDKPVIFLPECVDTNFFKPVGLNDKAFNLGWAGSTFSLKRVHLLDQLKYKVTKQSEWGMQYFLQDRNQDCMLRFYQTLNAFILMSITECMPRVVLESMSCGLPVISTNVGNIPFLIDSKWIVPVYPEQIVVKEINNRLDLLKKDFKLQQQVAQRNRQYIIDNFSWLKMQPYWDKIFSLLADGETNKILEENESYLNNGLELKQHFERVNIQQYKQTIVYILPGTGISGGVAVILQHANRLKDKGYNVFLLSQNLKTFIPWYTENKVKIIPLDSNFKNEIQKIDILVATSWSTVEVSKNIEATRKIYFVQSDERRFYDDEKTKQLVHNTYQIDYEYMTEAKWIQNWLREEFGIISEYVPNGLDEKIFSRVKIEEKHKFRVLIEGPLTIPFKGVVDSYEAVKNLDCEIWFVSSDGKPPKHWRYNKFFEKIPMNKMKNIYSSCDVLLKMSRVEGFFGPPMEAMACECAVVVSKCTGYDEYIIHENNALVVETGDILSATKAVQRLMNDEHLKQKLIKNGLSTVKQWSWDRSISLLEAMIFNNKKHERVKKNKTIEVKITEQKINGDQDVCDIIIIVHNALSYLHCCIESIKKNTDFPYKISIVNNNSNYDVEAYLKTLNNVNVITNKKNYGFGYANNQVIRRSKNKYICLLNSDTIVTKNWLSRMIKVFEATNAGIVGPVSNNVSSEIQQINFDYIHNVNDQNDIKIKDFSETCFRKQSFNVSETNRLIGFCMLTTKEVIKNIGVFDDRYEFNFEDDDLCLRAIEQGYKLYCSLGVFIYHFGGQTFKDRFKVQTHNTSLEESKKLYLEKWYDTKRINSLHEKRNKFSIIYLLASNSPSGGVKIVFEHANRLIDRGYDVKIYCNKNENSSWFNVYAPVFYFSNYTEIPKCDIAIGTYFTTLPILQKINALVKIHLCQGYEVLLYDSFKEKPFISTIEGDYRKIKEKIAVSKWLKETIDPIYDIDCHYVPNGLDKNVFSFSKHKRNQQPKILIVGNYGLGIKGVNIALEAATKFLETSKGSIVRLASEKTKSDEKYDFYDMSKMTQDEIAKVYESCDVTICASYKVEGFSLPPLESMASGTPVITTDSGGVNDYAIKNENAIIVAPGNTKAIQCALNLLMSNEILYTHLVENGLKTANRYIWHNQIDMLEGLLHKLFQTYSMQSKELLSVCMIVKNEQENLSKCLSSVKDLANEIIIVDTGSTDNTISIAKKFGAKIFHFNWVDDFSTARNFALSKVTQPWVLILDADEVVSQKDLPKIRQHLKTKVAYSFFTRNYVDSKNIEDMIPCLGQYSEEQGIGWCKSEKVRLFPAKKEICFEGEVHELVENSLEKLNIEIKTSEVPIHHYGNLIKNKQKQDTYLKLGKKKLGNLESEKAQYELALQYMSLNNNDEALVLWRKLSITNPKNQDYLSHMGTVFNLLNDYKQAEQKFYESLKIKETHYALKHLAICYAKQTKYILAYDTFKKIIYSTEDLKTMADFAFCCNMLKRFDESIVILEKCLKINKKETISWGLLDIAYNEKGVELARKNRLPQALNMFRSALSINSSFDVARANVAEINKVMNCN